LYSLITLVHLFTRMKYFRVSLLAVFIIVIIAFLLIAYNIGVLAPLIPFYNYYGIEPPNDSWQTCKGDIVTMTGYNGTSDQMKKFEYWTVRAINEKRPEFCKNVGIYESGDILYPDEHKHAIELCNYLVTNNISQEARCGKVY
jgi:hypothetical protein